MPTDEIQFYGDTQTAPGNKTFWADNTTITSVEGANTGFAFNFSGTSLAQLIGALDTSGRSLAPHIMC